MCESVCLAVRDHTLTELIKMCIHTICSWNGTHQSSLEKSCPLVGQTSQTAYIILKYTNALVEHLKLVFI